MRRVSGGKMSGAQAGLALAAALVLALVTWWRWSRPRPIREVLFFPSQPSCIEALLAEAAGLGSADIVPCPCPLPRLDCSLSRLLRRLLSARHSLDICLFAFCSPQLGQVVWILHRRGVRVRLITDAMSMGFSGSQIGFLRQAGIQVRHDEKTGYMHHKFAVVDRRILVTGSLNWTTEAIQNNRENVLILEDVEYVKPFLDEFERIWGEYDPSNCTFSPQRQ